MPAAPTVVLFISLEYKVSRENQPTRAFNLRDPILSCLLRDTKVSGIDVSPELGRAW